jgi:NTP pyrophosphatase (non-canonical NTP hydrolase)
MSDMTLDEFQRKATPVRPEPKLPGATMMIYQSNALCGEAGEVANVTKKVMRDGTLSQEMDRNLLDECGDVLFYLGRTLHHAGYTLSEAAAACLRKLEEAAAEMETA